MKTITSALATLMLSFSPVNAQNLDNTYNLGSSQLSPDTSLNRQDSLALIGIAGIGLTYADHDKIKHFGAGSATSALVTYYTKNPKKGCLAALGMKVHDLRDRNGPGACAPDPVKKKKNPPISDHFWERPNK